MGRERWLRSLVLLAACACVAAPARAQPEAATVDNGIAAFRIGAFAEAARDWYGAADQGDARAARFLGVMFDTGEGVRRDPEVALRWYRRSAELGDAPAMLNVAVMLDAGIAGPRDPAAAAHWYRMAADHHVGRAAYDLALLYRSGDGVPRDPARSRALMRQAATDGVSAASGYLPSARRVEPRGIVIRVPSSPPVPVVDPLLDAQRALLSRSPEQKALAVALFRRAAAGGGEKAAMASYDLGWCYENGIGVPADRDEAYRSYLRAAATTADDTTRDLAETGATAMRNGSGAGEPVSGTAGFPSPPTAPGTPAASPDEPRG